MKTGIIYSKNKDSFFDEVYRFLQAQGIMAVQWNSLGASLLRMESDFSVVIGGDGTVLAAGRNGVKNPILVINTGHLGFLTSSNKDNYQETILRFLQGNYTVTKRRTLHITHTQIILPASFWNIEYDAVNEVVIAKNTLSKLVNVAVYVSEGGKEELLSEYRADGLIVSTPTGSTAYNLSAGGPIIHPSCESFVVTPICPQGLTHRPLIIPASMRIRIKPLESELFLSVDGQEGSELWISPDSDKWDNRESPCDYVSVEYNSHCMEIVNPLDSYFQILRQKLGWGVKPV